MPPALSFVPLRPEHMPLLWHWLQQPHVREFWDDGHRTLPQVEAHYLHRTVDTDARIIRLDGQLAGYIQAYRVRGEDAYAAWRSRTGQTLGLDLFIGEPRWLGQGQAPAIIRAFVREVQRQEPELARLLIDPDRRNARAQHVYQKVGFRPVGQAGEQLILVLNLDRER